ncbi:agmatine deiminase [Alkalilimnicola ehrlichii]|uniref:Agmatine deiminase n=1 Tax=Alkalilimnicola ehrlichii TaxID=351052 RepID=A0A3E0WPD7_9GAMM|nr:agmatine deiminase family protein [Alkalilimnicola ehrlichii]RFA24565.1 agmatine deiminase [Alkalilimnicola ehrlichii]RFA33815.1 agmatine deiminase [Alkalilimnicola ehrlichii]
MKHPLRPRTRVRLPAEWERQAGVMLTWPHADSDWGDKLAAAHAEFLDLACHIAHYEPLLIVCHDASVRDQVAADLGARQVDNDRIAFVLCPSDDVWARDHGPITVYQEGAIPLLLDFTFNGWGGKYAHDLDDLVTRRLYATDTFGTTDCRRIEWILEGGSIDSDGQGSILSTTQCLLTDTRNAGMSLEQVEMQLQQRLGASRILWLHEGDLEGDDTDSHVDMLARFANPETIVYQQCDDPADPHFPKLQAMAKELAAFRTLQDRPYRLLPLPWPAAQYAEDGHRLPLSYANFLIVNGAVIVPQYMDQADEEALSVIRRAFPDRQVVGTPARTLIGQHGSVHCVTMQIPSAVQLPGLGKTVSAA